MPDAAAGARIQAARERAARKPAECAAQLDISPKRYRELEAGTREPELVQLAQLAAFLDVPLGVLLGRAPAPGPVAYAPEQLRLRARVIGAQLRQARIARDQNLDEVALALNMPARELNAIELAEQLLPLSLAQRLAAYFQIDIEDLAHPPQPERELAQRAREAYDKLPADIRTALQDPQFLTHVRAGLRLRALSRKDLRRAAKSLQKLAGALPNK
jgi:transcriptional regulator with XRE-family HTH domain